MQRSPVTEIRQKLYNAKTGEHYFVTVSHFDFTAPVGTSNQEIGKLVAKFCREARLLAVGPVTHDRARGWTTCGPALNLRGEVCGILVSVSVY